MTKYILSCCSTADLTKEHLEARDIKYVCFHYTMDGTTYPDDLGVSMPFVDFYQSLETGSDSITSQVNTLEFEEFFTPYLEEGYDIIHLTLSSGISGAYNSAQVAQAELQEKFPDRKIYIIDSLAASGGYGLLMDKAADLRDAGMSVDELKEWIEENKLRLNHWFFSMDLSFFIKGGRISKTAGTIGNMLNICPLMNVDYEGHLIVRQKLRGKKKCMQEALNKILELVDEGKDYTGKVYINHSACYDDARKMADMIEEALPMMLEPVKIEYIGTVIGTHTGPGTVAIFFWGDKRED